MNVYRLRADCDHYQNLTLVNFDDDWETLYEFKGMPIDAAWRPLRVRPLEEDLSLQSAPGDCPSLFSGEPTLSLRAAEVLDEILDGNGELLPLECEEGRYFIFNVTRVVDALDEMNSEIVRFANSQRVMTIKRFGFVPAQLEGVDVFKLPQLPLAHVFVTDNFVSRSRESGLLGFRFEWLWSSDQRSSSELQFSLKSIN